MPKKTKRRGRHIPQRTCIGCYEVCAKRELMRIVRTSKGVEYDETGKVSGRGAYLHKKKSCWKAALEGNLTKKLRIELSAENKQYLITIMDSLPDAVENE